MIDYLNKETHKDARSVAVRALTKWLIVAEDVSVDASKVIFVLFW